MARKRGRLTIEGDELWSFVGHKANKRWIWHALDADTRRVVGVHVGARDRAGAEGLWRSLPGTYRQRAVCYTDWLVELRGGAAAIASPGRGEAGGEDEPHRALQLHASSAGEPPGATDALVLEEAHEPRRGDLAVRASLQRILTTLALPSGDPPKHDAHRA